MTKSRYYSVKRDSTRARVLKKLECCFSSSLSSDLLVLFSIFLHSDSNTFAMTSYTPFSAKQLTRSGRDYYYEDPLRPQGILKSLRERSIGSQNLGTARDHRQAFLRCCADSTIAIELNKKTGTINSIDLTCANACPKMEIMFAAIVRTHYRDVDVNHLQSP